MEGDKILKKANKKMFLLKILMIHGINQIVEKHALFPNTSNLLYNLFLLIIMTAISHPF